MAKLSTDELYGEYVALMRKLADTRYAAAVLQWDQETYLPPKGAAIRGQQIATISEISHRLFTDSSTGRLLQELVGRQDLTGTSRKNVELTLEDYNKQTKISAEFVRRLAETVNRSFHHWIEARKANDFFVFAPDLSELALLKKEEAGLLGYEQHPYDALLNEYDKGSTVAQLDRTFDDIKKPLQQIIHQIQQRPQVSNAFLQKHYHKNEQWELGLRILKELDYDFEAGRQDLSEHPFTTSFNNRDVRITTRIHENDLASMIWSCIHELGHALYEQGLPDEGYGLPLGEAASLSIHESQSRLWENHVGRSMAFCERYFPLLQQYFPEQLRGITVEQFFQGINKVTPSLIRTEADEVTYHFHVMIRYELEKKLIEGSLDAREIPGFWNENYRSYLGVQVPDDKRGCLQDVHWSHGSFGYFPTYSTGSFYAAQIFEKASQQINDMNEHIRSGTTRTLLQWLREQVHLHGRMYTSRELCQQISGEGLNSQHFLSYLLAKYRKIYNF